MTGKAPSRKPIEDDALFKTLRELHPSDAQLRDILIVERDTLERLQTSSKAPSRIFSGRRTKEGKTQRLRRQ